MSTDIHSKLYAHELRRRHATGDAEKLAGTLLDAQVDLNPHQVAAALFAFQSPLSKGAILADEVGLGKTIEAGLLLSQRWTEGARRILVITPANLRKQWAQEMAEKFFLPTTILEAASYKRLEADGMRPFEQNAIIICSLPFAARHEEEIMTTRWDLAVIDEAHRLRNVYKNSNKTGKALKSALANVPKVLLTATPLQNSLMELYGLVSIIDDYAFGDAKSFRAQYAQRGDANFDSLKERLTPLCHRTLRRQVTEYVSYTNRVPLTEEFTPTEAERQLYKDVSDYLQRDELEALPSSQRTLMTLVMRKLLASSTFAIAGMLHNLAAKLERQLKTDQFVRKAIFEAEADEDIDGFRETREEWGAENIDDDADFEPELLTEEQRATIGLEIEELRTFADEATAITQNAKGEALLKALRAGFDKAEELGAARKAIIFTESRRTQDYLVSLLSANSYADKLVLFNGSNTDERSKAIYSDWVDKHRGSDRVTGSRSADIRAALVDHFRDSAEIMIATEAAAEGINLQFCSIVVNYDLPWNPQRIEQRIGRCHRYGQKHDVVVVNFLNRENAADQRVYELLNEKFQLFEGVFGASDEVLGAIGSGVDFEKRISEIYQNCRTAEDIEASFKALRAEMEQEIDATMQDTRRTLLEHFDAEVHDRLKINLDRSKEYMNRYERKLWAVTKHELGRDAAFDDDHLTFTLKKAVGPSQPGGFFLGKAGLDGHRYRIGHPLAQFLLDIAAQRDLPPRHLVFDYTNWEATSAALKPFVGLRGSIACRVLSVTGVDAQDHIVLAAITDEGKAIDPTAARRLFDLPVNARKADKMPDDLGGALDEQFSEILTAIDAQRADWLQQEMDKLDDWAEDKRTGLKADLKKYDDELADLKKRVRLAGSLQDKLTLQRAKQQCEKKRDEAWRAYDGEAKEIEERKERLLDRVAEQLTQDTETTDLFTITFEII
ncbi:DEAD/DEAH box helicase [Qipengyuania sp. 1NDH17]|uniref:DEAD/DEAH box helicase n=1 Tax=Qipengyuania polymorpha TaxID=2867234 RepID=A0ABS7J0M3_9SPHN|nr:SNF2-related protein [Qipengyuania polymorpha]MBX7459361.1 DEAD/DEAH box helicase [Qipengyuania polymorpha]